MKQPRIQEHFPSKKPMDFRGSESELHPRKRSSPDFPSQSEQSGKRTVGSLDDPRPCGATQETDFAEEARKAKVELLLADSAKVHPSSALTASILKELNVGRPSRPSPVVDDILSSVEPKERFHGLLVPQRGLSLPWEYNRLLTLFESCDTVLSFMRRRHEQPAFPRVRRAVESSTALKFSEAHLQQILHVFPAAYALHWAPTCPRGFLLLVSLPESPDLRRRLSSFRELLLGVTMRHHNAFIATLPSRPQIHPERIHCWYHKFDLHAVPSLPLAELPPRPADENETVINEFLRMQTARNDPVLEELPTNTQPLLLPHSKYFSPAIKARLRLSSSQDSSPAQAALDTKRRNAETFCEMLKVLFVTHRTPSMFLDSLLRKVEAARRFDLSLADLRALLLEVIDIFPSWLHLFSTSMGEIVRIDRRNEMLMTTISGEIAAHYA